MYQLEKMQIFTEVEYLNHVILKDTIKPTEAKFRAVAGFPTPTSVKMVRSFLGLIRYLRKFIPNYSIIARPLTELLKKEAVFNLGDKEKDAITKLKTALACKPVLKLIQKWG